MSINRKVEQKLLRFARGLGLIAILIAILPMIIAPPLMDVRFWFIQYVSEMDYSALNIYSVWQQRLNPGRFVPISDIYGLIYSFLGHSFLQTTHAPVNYFESITKLALITLVFVALRSLFRELSKGYINSRNRALWETYPLLLFIFWGLGLNIFWQLNGSAAYPLLIYTVFLISILFALSVLKLLRNLVHADRILNSRTITLLVLSSIWANFYYELAYSAIAVIVVTIFVAPIKELTNEVRIKLASLFIFSFSVVWVPMRWILKMQCDSQIDLCYSGSQLNLKGAPLTFLQNLVSPLPLADSNSLSQLAQGRLPFVFSALVVTTAILISLIVFFNLHTAAINRNLDYESDMVSFISCQWRFTLILLSMGISSAVVLSVSIRAQEIVNWGNSYRHTPILWMAYASILLLGITWVTQRTKPLLGTAAIVALVLVLTTGQWGRSWSAVSEYNSDFEPVSRLYHELYVAESSDLNLANARRCLIFDELSQVKRNSWLYLNTANKYMQKYHDVDFCVK